MRIRHLFTAVLVACAFAPLVDGATAPTTTVAGTAAVPGTTGDGGPAAQALLEYPTGVAVAADGSILIADSDGRRIRRIGPDGIIDTVAGDGVAGFSGDGGPATGARFDGPVAVAPLPGGGFLVADALAGVIRRIGADGMISTVAGIGLAGFGGDGAAADAAVLDHPLGVVAFPGGGFAIADTYNSRVRKVDAAGIITTIAGTGVAGDLGDGGPAVAAQLNLPAGLAVAADGSLLIADQGNHRIRRVGADGIIATVAGTEAGLAGDGGPAVAAELATPAAVATTPDGGFVIADQDNNVIRRVGPDGVISTLGDAATAAGLVLNLPAGAAVTAAGDVIVADSGNSRVMRIPGARPAAAAAPAPTPVVQRPLKVTVLRAWRSGRTVRIRVRVNRPATAVVRARLAPGGTRVIIRRRVRSGVTTLVWRVPRGVRLVSADRRRFTVTATAPGARAVARIRLP